MPFSPSAAGRATCARPALRAAFLSALLLIGGIVGARAQDAGAQLSAEQAASFAQQAATWQRELSERIMPFWYDRTIDRELGGYALPQSGTPDKVLVSQARLIWGFSHAWRQGIRDPQRDYLAAATEGYNFMRKYFRDAMNGGYFWTTSRVGRPLNLRKFLYGQACVLYALVEYYRASGDAMALQDAADLYKTIMERTNDSVNGGWTEHFQLDWQPILEEEEEEEASETQTFASGTESTLGRPSNAQELLLEPEIVVDVGIVGTKSGEAHLQLMEALTQLLLVSREPGASAVLADLKVENALAEVLDLNLKYFFPKQAGQAYPYRQPDWQRPLGARYREISYGRNVEFAWQMLATQTALGRELDWPRFDAILKHTLKHGFDDELGGLYAIGFGDRPALATEKVWWAQAEMLAALTTGVQHSADPDRIEALDQLISFLNTYQTDKRDGIWFEAVKADGSQWRPAKTSRLKTSLHDVRAMTKFIEAFGAS